MRIGAELGLQGRLLIAGNRARTARTGLGLERAGAFLAGNVVFDGRQGDLVGARGFGFGHPHSNRSHDLFT